MSSAVVVAAAVGSTTAAARALAVLAASALVELVLVLSLLVLRSLSQAEARNLIIEGRGDLPLQLLAREQRRLTSARTQATLARALERFVGAAAAWPRIHPTARPVFDVRQVRTASPQLEALAEMLRSQPRQPRGIARLERLLTDGTSPLYGQEPDELRRELELIRKELERSGG